MEGYSTCLDPTKPDFTLAVGGGWEMNTGAFSVKKTAKPLLEKWVEVFKEDPDRFAYFQSGEQQGESILNAGCGVYGTVYYMKADAFRVLFDLLHLW